MALVIDLQTLTDEELGALLVSVGPEWERRQALKNAEKRIEDEIAAYQAAQGIHDRTAWQRPTGLHDAVPPGQSRVFPDGREFRNISGTYLVHEPAEYPRGWELVAQNTTPVEPAPQEYAAWSANVDYVAGDLVSFNGSVYRCVQGHRSLSNWQPTVVPALWTKV